MSLLVLLAAAAVVGRILTPHQAPVELLLAAALAALWGALAEGSPPRRSVALLAVAAALAAGASPMLATPEVTAIPRPTDGPATGVVRWARTGADGTLAWIDPAEAARGPPDASPLAAAVRVRSDARRPLDPGTLVLLPSSAARAARLGPAAGDPRGAPTVGVRPDALARIASGSDGGAAAAARTALERAIDGRTGDAAPALRSVVLGQAWRLGAAERDALRDIGVSHLLALSGFNLALLAWLLAEALLAIARGYPSLLLRFDARRVAAAVVLPAVWAFTAMVGWQPSVVRASLMISAVLVARLLARRATALDALALAALAVFVAVPEQAADPGFQLSFAAVAGLLLAARVARSRDHDAERRGREPFRRKWAAEASGRAVGGRADAAAARVRVLVDRIGRWVLLALLASTFAALATAPIGAWHFGTVAPASPLANLVAVPFFTFVVYPLALLAALVAAAPLPASIVDLCAAAAGGAWNAFVRLCEGLGRVLPGPLDVGDGGTFGVAVVSVALAFLFHPGRGPRRVALLLLALLGVSDGDLGAALRPEAGRPPPPPRGAVEVVFLDVGDGDATLCVLPDGTRLLVDGGPAPGERNRGPRSRTLADELRRRGIARIDLAVLSHPHPDHFGGLIDLFHRVAFDELWLSPQAEAEGPDGEVSLWARALERRGTVVRRTPGICGRHSFGDTRLEVLAPCGAAGFDVALDENDNSLVLRLEVGRHRLLLTGDAGVETEARLLAAGATLEVDVLKVAHHGSRTSTSDAFLAAVRPRWAVVSAALHRVDHRGPPHAEVLARLAASGATLVRTAIAKTVTVHLGPESVTVYDGGGRMLRRGGK